MEEREVQRAGNHRERRGGGGRKAKNQEMGGGAREGLAKSVKIWAVVSEEIICCDYSPEEAVVSP